MKRLNLTLFNVLEESDSKVGIAILNDVAFTILEQKHL